MYIYLNLCIVRDVYVFVYKYIHAGIYSVFLSCVCSSLHCFQLYNKFAIIILRMFPKLIT